MRCILHVTRFWGCLGFCVALFFLHPCPRVAEAAGRSSAGKPAAGKQAAGKEDRIVKKARELAALAEAAKVRGNPAVALQLFQQAYDVKPLPIFLFRMAQCHKGMGNAGRASFSYRQYLKYAVDIPDRPEVEEMAKQMETLATAVRNEGGKDGETQSTQLIEEGEEGKTHHRWQVGQ